MSISTLLERSAAQQIVSHNEYTRAWLVSTLQGGKDKWCSDCRCILGACAPAQVEAQSWAAPICSQNSIS